MSVAKAYAAYSATTPLEPATIDRRTPGPHDVDIDIEYCGLCHSDVHTVRGEWGNTHWPMTPGHEIIGTVSAVGDQVQKFKPGDSVGVGCIVDSCRECPQCLDGTEQYCTNGMTGTYAAVDRRHDDAITQGGYASSIVVDENYVLRIPEGLDKAATAPLLCAGITTYSPLRHWGVSSGSRVGVVGLGGLGHMGVKLAKALGAEVTVFTTSPAKADAAQALGADRVVVSTDAEQMKAANRSLDFIVDTVAASHELEPYLMTLDVNGVLVQVGLPEHSMPPIRPGLMLFRRLSYAGSGIGGIQETQEMLDFCAEKGITADIEMVTAEQINAAYERMVAGDVQYRFVLDTATL